MDRPQSFLSQYVPDRGLHPQLSVEPMGKFHMCWHRSLSRGSQALEKHAFQPELGNTFVLFDFDPHLEKSVTVSDALFQGRISAADNNRGAVLVHNLEVIGDLGP